MAKKKSTTQAPDESAAQIISYRHADKRKNNPEVGIVTPATDPEAGKTRWAYDPHIDPALQFDPSRAAIEKLIDDALASGDQAEMAAALQELKRQQSPYLNWAGKAERTSFDIDTVSLHVHALFLQQGIHHQQAVTTHQPIRPATFMAVKVYGFAQRHVFKRSIK